MKWRLREEVMFRNPLLVFFTNESNCQFVNVNLHIVVVRLLASAQRNYCLSLQQASAHQRNARNLRFTYRHVFQQSWP